MAMIPVLAGNPPVSFALYQLSSPVPYTSASVTTRSATGRLLYYFGSRPGEALGAEGPQRMIAALRRRDGFIAAFEEARELAGDMAQADEADPPDEEIWRFAFQFLQDYAESVSPPLVSPLQVGGISAEWHDHGLNIELRFRGVRDAFVLIEDAREELCNFQGRDPSFSEARAALLKLAERSV